MSQKAYDIVIAGGGMVGLLTACAFGGTALKVAVIDRRREPPRLADEFDPRVSAITLASRAIFESVGAWPEIERGRVAPFREMHVREGGIEPLETAARASAIAAPGGGSIHFDCAEIGEACLGYIIENGVIVTALLKRLETFTNVHYIAPAEVSEIEVSSEEVRISLADKRTLAASVLIGAEGADSRVRRAAGIDTWEYNFNQQGIVATVATEKPHRDTARQVFLPSGPLALLPLSDPQRSSMVWSVDSNRAQALMELEDGEFIGELRTVFGDALGEIQSISSRLAFPLVLSHARAYVAPRVALIGDAAHVVHPLAGQGVNLGFLDAAALSEVLLDGYVRDPDVGSPRVLRRYERWRQAGNLTMLAVTGGLKELFGSKLPGVKTMRRLGLDLTDAVTPVKNFVMKRASGLSGDLPRLAKRRLHT
jgi:2-octaprenylphenol hydroxylase